jgi:hypothetical protein
LKTTQKTHKIQWIGWLCILLLTNCQTQGEAHELVYLIEPLAQFNPQLLGILQVLVFSVMVFGLLSLITQIIPGLTIIWLAALFYGFATGFTWLGIILIVLISGLMVLGGLMDEILMGARAHKSGARWWAIILAILAGVWGSLTFPPFGGLVIALVALFTLEMLRLNDWRKAAYSAKEMAIGCGHAFFARFGIGLVMILLWGIWVWLAR